MEAAHLQDLGDEDPPPNDEEFDAFNDDTFGDAQEWQEGDHEELAQITEEERRALKQSNDFFGFGGNDDDELLEELEPRQAQNGDSSKHLASQFQHSLTLGGEPKKPSQIYDDPAIRGVMPSAPRPMHQGPPDDPAIMTMGNLPMPMPGMPPPAHSLPPPNMLPPHMMPRPQQQQHLPRQPMHPNQMPPPQYQHMQRHPDQFGFGGGPDPRRQPPQPRSMQEIEMEMMRQQNERARFHHQQQQQHMAQRHHSQPQQHQFHHHHQQEQFRQHQHHHPHYHQQQQPYHHHHGRYQQQSNYNNRQRGGNRYDDRNSETFGDDFVQEANQSRHFRERDSARRDLMPGHVHTLGILRGARERQQRSSTGNPQLDLELERRQEHDEDWDRHYYSRSTDDPYAGLMTSKERQWIINIQMEQLKIENPFIQDYYFTVHNQKRAMAEADEDTEAEEAKGLQMKRTEEGPQLLLQSAEKDTDRSYKPVQFTNSLGKLQAISIKAPRKIIDVGVVKEDTLEGSSSAQKELRKYKSILMEIERLYTLLIEAEDCEKKLAALPTNTSLWSQVQLEQGLAVQRLCATLATENRIKRYLMVRKGKILLKRTLRMLDDTCIQLFCSTLFQLFPLVAKKDKEDKIMNTFWPELKRHISSASFELLQLYMKLLNAGSATTGSTPKISLSTYKQVLTHPLGMSVLLSTLNQFGIEDLTSEEQAEAKVMAQDVMKAVSEASELAKPLDPVDLKAIFNLEKDAHFKKLQAVAIATV